MSDSLCPNCKYDRSGDRSVHCPECGSDEHPVASGRIGIGNWFIFPALHICTAIWLPLYLLLVRATYKHGIEQDGYDKTVQLAIGAAVGLITAGSYLAWRRRGRVVLFPLIPGVILLILLVSAIAAGVWALFEIVTAPDVRS